MMAGNPVAHVWSSLWPRHEEPTADSVRALLCRPLTEQDLYAADHSPASTKWELDRQLLGAPYAARHARRAFADGRKLQGAAWAGASVLPGACGIALCCTLIGALPGGLWGEVAQKRPHRRSRLGAQEDRITSDIQAVKAAVSYGCLSISERRRNPLGTAQRDRQILALLTAAVDGLAEARLRRSTLIRAELHNARHDFARQHVACQKELRREQTRAALCGPVAAGV